MLRGSSSSRRSTGEGGEKVERLKREAKAVELVSEKQGLSLEEGVRVLRKVRSLRG